MSLNSATSKWYPSFLTETFPASKPISKPTYVVSAYVSDNHFSKLSVKFVAYINLYKQTCLNICRLIIWICQMEHLEGTNEHGQYHTATRKRRYSSFPYALLMFMKMVFGFSYSVKNVRFVQKKLLLFNEKCPPNQFTKRRKLILGFLFALSSYI